MDLSRFRGSLEHPLQVVDGKPRVLMPSGVESSTCNGIGLYGYYLPETDMHYAVALQRRGGTMLRVVVEGVYELTPEAFAIDDDGLLWRCCGACTERSRNDGSTWEQVWRYDTRLVPAFRLLGVGRFTY